MIEIFMLYLSIPSRINFLQLGCYSRFGEQRFLRQFEQGFDFFSFNKALSMPWIGSRTAVAFDPSFIHKSGRKTPGIGYFWSGCAGRALRGIEFLFPLEQPFHNFLLLILRLGCNPKECIFRRHFPHIFIQVLLG